MHIADTVSSILHLLGDAHLEERIPPDASGRRRRKRRRWGHSPMMGVDIPDSSFSLLPSPTHTHTLPKEDGGG